MNVKFETIENIAHYKLVEKISARGCRVTAHHYYADEKLADKFESLEI